MSKHIPWSGWWRSAWRRLSRNARLIVAAPKLLSLAKAILDSSNDKHYDAHEHLEAKDAMRILIVRIEGKPEVDK